jgi:hypothetical protein
VVLAGGRVVEAGAPAADPREPAHVA